MDVQLGVILALVAVFGLAISFLLGLMFGKEKAVDRIMTYCNLVGSNVTGEYYRGLLQAADVADTGVNKHTMEKYRHPPEEDQDPGEEDNDAVSGSGR